jgi:deoxyribonuclease IV
VDDQTRVGVCLDTCHSYAAGYDLKTKVGYEQVFSDFDRIVGLKYLKGMHLNDTKKGLSQKVDRHESLGKGILGIEPFRYIMTDPRLDDLPLILETPNEELWAGEIALLYGLAGA